MHFEYPSLRGTFVKRYKRFFVDIALPNGEIVTAHCANTGSMKGLLEEGNGATLLDHNDPKRKLRYSLELLHTNSSPVGVNTARPNRLVEAALHDKMIPPLAAYSGIQREVKYGKEKSRIDLLLRAEGLPDCYVEIKNVTLAERGIAMFPDAVTARGQKHLRELAEMVAQGHRAVIFFLVQRMDCTAFAPADAIDPTYGALLREVMAQGVEAFAWDCAIDEDGVELRNMLPVTL